MGTKHLIESGADGRQHARSTLMLRGFQGRVNLAKLVRDYIHMKTDFKHRVVSWCIQKMS